MKNMKKNIIISRIIILVCSGIIIMTINGCSSAKKAVPVEQKQEVNQQKIPTENSPSTTRSISSTSEVTTSKNTIHLPILMYHYVRIVTDPKDKLGIDLSVPPDMFDQQMKLLVDKGFTTITLDDFVNSWKTSTPLPQKSIILTFDDGYDDFYTAAFPILKKYNIKATTYVVTGFLDKLHYLTKSQLKELSQSPLITIASHTLTHADLKTLTGKKLHDEIFESKAWLENFTGHTIDHFAYPFGRYLDATIQETKKAGYLTATTTHFGNTHTEKDQLTTTRVRIAGTISLKAFEKLINE